MSIPDRLGDFRIVEEIGRGGFGVVYRARQESLDRPVALKVLFQHKVHTEDEIGRFEREARAAARLDHSGIVSVYAWGKDGTDFYIAQKLVGEGRTVADEVQLLKTGGEPPKGYFRRVAGWAAVVAEALQHAHERGIVHRDVKPSNILLDENDRPFLGDFGLAKVEDGLELSRTGDFAGSPFYMSPEQADSRRGQVDHRSDIYALGVTLYELLTLQPPFQGQSSHEIIRKILTEDPRRPSRIEPRVPSDLETICLKAMEKSRVHRYQSAEALAHDLTCFLDGEPITAAPPSAVSRVLRSARRHRTKVGMLALGGALLGAIGYAYVNYRSFEHERAQQATHELAREAEDGADKVLESLAIDEQIDQALANENLPRARELREKRKAVADFLQSGSEMLVNLLPNIRDSEVVKDIGSAMQDQMLFGGMQAVQRFLAEKQQDSGAAETDPNLAAVSSWLTNVTTELEGFDLSKFGVVTPGVDSGAGLASGGQPSGGVASMTQDGLVDATSRAADAGGSGSTSPPVLPGFGPGPVALGEKLSTGEDSATAPAPTSPEPVPPGASAVLAPGVPDLHQLDADAVRRLPWFLQIEWLRHRMQALDEAASSQAIPAAGADELKS